MRAVNPKFGRISPAPTGYELTMEICHKRRDLLGRARAAAGPDAREVLRRARFHRMARRAYGQGFVDYMIENYEPVDFLIRPPSNPASCRWTAGGVSPARITAREDSGKS